MHSYETYIDQRGQMVALAENCNGRILLLLNRTSPRLPGSLKMCHEVAARNLIFGIGWVRDLVKLGLSGREKKDKLNKIKL